MSRLIPRSPSVTLPHHRRRARPGFLLVEVLLGLAIFAIFLSAVAVVILSGQQDTIRAGDYTRGAYYAMRAVEGSRAIRDSTFTRLTDGKHGIALASSGVWLFNGTSVTSSGYVSYADITTLASGWKQVTGTSKWKFGNTRSGAVTIVSEMTDWSGNRATGNWSAVSQQGFYDPGSSQLFNDIAVKGNYLYATSDGGPGLTILDISNLASPTRVATSFTLGAAGNDVAIYGDRLIVGVADSSQEIRVYDISSPATLTSANLFASYNAPGSQRVRSFALDGNRLYVTETQSAVSGEYEMEILDITSTGVLTFHSGYHDDSELMAVSVTGTGAYLASQNDISELRIVDVEDISVPVLASPSGWNLTGSEDGTVIQVTGTSGLLGRSRGAISELVLFDTRAIGSSPGPWYHETNASVMDVATDATACYGFVASNSGYLALKVLNLQNAALPQLTLLNNGTDAARGVFYDVVRDRLYLATSNRVIVLRPSGVGTGPCP